MLLKMIKKILAVMLVAGAAQSAGAFSLLGPLDGAFQTTALGYSQGGDIGGPMNLGEEYRWNTPVLTYAFDESFLNYFGTEGVVAVERAIQILNDLPAADSVTNGPAGDPNLYANGTPFPTSSRLLNFQAQQLGLLDMRSITLTLLLEEMGLADPERWTWCLRNRLVVNNVVVNYLVIQRNFDPVNWQPSRHVNGVLYGYNVFDNGTVADAVERVVDPLATRFTSVAGSFFGFGEFYHGLTRDDMGGLRYLYRYNNFNRETLRTGVTAPTNSNPWDIIGITNSFPTPAVSLGIRPGLQKITFQPAAIDSLIGTVVPYTNRYTDVYITNSAVKQQAVQYIASAPDILFTADDLGVFGNGAPVVSQRSATASWQNNDAINGSQNLAGPGVIAGTVTTLPTAARIVITYNKVGPSFLVFPSTGLLTDDAHSPQYLWGAWDGIDDTPVVFPNSLSVQQLEQLLLGR
ncbi:MAG: hypothetical protein HZA89_07360 [Verrucomicrobia bacterium]|nr:hypothetical protein [Verrucomicrobiota bacterium]